jgi:dUTP pyrophosphatase
MLFVARFREDARMPICSHPGEDLGYDIFALDDVEVDPFSVTKVRTGIAAQYSPWGERPEWIGKDRYGLLVKDRGSMAAAGLFTVGGVIDASYTGEIIVMFRNVGQAVIDIHAHEKIAQLVPIKVLTSAVVRELAIGECFPFLTRGERGFGSSDHAEPITVMRTIVA